MLSMRAKYAIKALLYLERQPRGAPVLIGSIAGAEGIPKKMLEQVLLELRNRGYLQSRQGKHGGYLLAMDPGRIRMGDIVRLFNGPLALVPCASQTAYQRCADCRDEGACAIRLVMMEVRDATARILDQTTLAAMAKAPEGGRAAKALNFSI